MRKNQEAEQVDIFSYQNNEKFPPNNGAILTIAKIIKAVMSLAAEAELGTLYINAKEAIHLRQILEEMDHPQLQTPIQTDVCVCVCVLNCPPGRRGRFQY